MKPAFWPPDCFGRRNNESSRELIALCAPSPLPGGRALRASRRGRLREARASIRARATPTLRAIEAIRGEDYPPRMPDGALTLSDARGPTLTIACERCGRYGRYSVRRLIVARGTDAKLTDLLVTLADCPKARSVSIHDRRKVVY